MARKVLLVGGVLSSLLYVIGIDVIAALGYPDYHNYADQMVSELFAVGAPTRTLMVWLSIPYNFLVFALAVGVWASAGGQRATRFTAAALVGYGAVSTAGLLLFPMDVRGTVGSQRDTLHIIATIVMSMFIVAVMAFGAFAHGTRFRMYSFATIAIVTVFGACAGVLARPMPEPTPWLGLAERVNIYATMLWVAVLAVSFLRVQDPNVSSAKSVFKTPEGEAAFLAAYDAAMKLWPVPYEEMEIPSRFGMTHVVASGPKDAPPLVLLHGYWATLTMWTLNIADFSKDHRVYAIDVMGQPSKSIPQDPIRNAADYAAWLTATLDGLHLERVSLVGMSYGGWLALNFAVAAPERVQRLVLLSPGGGFTPMAKQFSLRGMLMVWFPTRFTVNSFMHWLGFKDDGGDPDVRRVGDSVVDLMYLGLKHFRVPVETLRILPVLFPDDQLRAMRVPTLLLIGEHEVICDPAAALARARQLFPDVRAELVPRSSHDMCFSQHRIVDARVLDFLKSTSAASVGRASERVVA